jgi:uncharacterized membrane-anchored protein
MSARWLACLVLLSWRGASAQKLEKQPLTPQQLEAQLQYQTGRVTVRNGLATLELPADFRYLDARQAAMVLQAWGNPPGSRTLGMLLPSGHSVFAREAWAVVITYDEDGYVKDDDAAKIDYGDLLKKMQQGIRDENDERKRAGYPTVELVGWAEPPRYDSASHKLYWAKNLRFGDDTAHMLNYNIRVLGRRGVLVLNAVAEMDQLEQIKGAMSQVMGFVEFTDGHRYADFVPGTDKVAKYGIAALIAGGVAAKAGLFKVLLAALIGLKKLLVVALAAMAAFFRKLMGRKKAGGVGATPTA